ncbi:hypothetical protein ACGCUQ_07175 [Eubacteriales bacterium KG127]
MCKYTTINDYIFSFIFLEALRDATLRNAYTGDKFKLNNYIQFIKSQPQLKELVNNVINDKFDNQSEYDESFLSAANTICDYINDSNYEYYDLKDKFTFGNAQKLINMILKYFYIIVYNQNYLKNNFRFCHCPMDSIMLEKVWSQRDKWIHILGGEKLTATFFKKPWSTEEKAEEKKYKNGEKMPRRYKIFQEAVRTLAYQEKCETPLDFDYKNWK